MQEILLLIVIALALFYLPRLRAKKSPPLPATARRASLTGWIRLAIMGSLLWIASAAALLEPWQREILPFVYFGAVPVVVFWGALWVWFGYRQK
jgi:hypothetical protein